MWLHEPCLGGVPNVVSNHCGSINRAFLGPKLGEESIWLRNSCLLEVRKALNNQYRY